MASFKKFNIDVVNGVTHKVQYYFPSVGETEDFIEVRSMHCEQFRTANNVMSRTIAELRLANKDQPVSGEVLDDLADQAFAALVASWSFEEPCTVENIVEFIQANPQMRDRINDVASNNTLFFKK